MGPENITVVSVVVASCLAAVTIAGFVLFRHRSPAVVWSAAAATGSSGHDLDAPDPGAFAGSADDAHVLDPDDAPDPLIARRVASLAQRTEPRPAESARPVVDGHADDSPSGVTPAPRAARFGPGTALAGVGATVPSREPDTTPADAAVALVSPTLASQAHGEPPSTPDETLRQLLVDPVTGLGSRLAWDRWVAEEEVRERRYRRPATIVLAQVDGVEEVAAFLGADSAARIVLAIAEIVRANVRASDHAAVVGPANLAALLPETDEVRAVNFVERVRVSCDAWLASNAPTVRIGFGWASPGPANDLTGARATAERRLARDLDDAPAGAIRG